MSSKVQPTTKTEPVDMSRRAITGRLESVGALYKLGMALREIRMDQAKPVNPRPVKPPSDER
jgi:hypothetical protein